MAFDGRGYYSRSVRDGDRVHRVYFGKGPAAQLAARLDEQRRSERLARSQAWRAEEAGRAAAEARLRELDELSDLMTRATLLAAGYHRHDRGAWRRRRMFDESATNGVVTAPEEIRGEVAATVPDGGATPGDRPPADAAGDRDRPLTEGELRELLGRAEQGDQTILPALRRLLDLAPHLWQYCGDVARDAGAVWVDLIAGRNLMVRESLTRKAAALKAELAGASAPPLERLLAERVVACWMQVAQADVALAELKGKGATTAQLDLLSRRQERTQRSYLAALKTLATVQRLATPRPTTAPTVAAPDGAETGPRRAREGGAEGVGSPAATPTADRRTRGRRRGEKVGSRKAAARASSVPKALRDRMRGLAGSEN